MNYDWYKDRPENVSVILGSMKMDTYKFISQEVDLCVCYDGQLSYESVFLDTPSICVGRGRFADPDVTYVPSNVEEYVKILKNPKSIIDDFKKTKVERVKAAKKLIFFFYNHINYNLGIIEGLARNRRYDFFSRSKGD